MPQPLFRDDSARAGPKVPRRRWKLTVARAVFSLVVGLGAGLYGEGAAADVMLGAHVGNEDDAHSRVEFHHLELQIGRQLAIDSDYENWADFPNAARIKWDLQTGRVPLQSWIVQLRSADPSACATASDILAGVYDAQLTRQAGKVKALGGHILVRFNYEMTTNPVNTCFTGFPVKTDIARAGEDYVKVWNHVLHILRQVGATNVSWVWTPGSPTFAQNLWSYFYPGSDQVDWVGIDSYNHTLASINIEQHIGIPEFLSAMTPLGKPMIISETAAFGVPEQKYNPQSRWINSSRAFLKRHPEIKAYVYWDVITQNRLPPPPYDGDGYRLRGSGMDAFRAMANDPYFGATKP